MDVTKLPIGGLIMGALAASLAITFALAFDQTVDTSGESEGSPEPTQLPPEGVDLVIAMIPTLKFDQTSLSIPANEEVVIQAANKDGSVTHNFAVYQSRAAAEGRQAALGATRICSRCEEDLTLNLQPASYFFKCDVHPNMTGTLTAE